LYPAAWRGTIYTRAAGAATPTIHHLTTVALAIAKSDIINTYPLPAYNYRVTLLDGTLLGLLGLGERLEIGFSEVSGLSMQTDTITYKHGLSFMQGPVVLKGQGTGNANTVNLTFKRGIITTGNNTAMVDWIKPGILARLLGQYVKHVVIDLCDPEGKPRVTWKIFECIPTKLDAPTFDASTNDVAIESLEIIGRDVKIDYHDDGLLGKIANVLTDVKHGLT